MISGADYANGFGTAGALLEDAYFSDPNDSFTQFWPGGIFEKLLSAEQATIGDDLRWICCFLRSLLALEYRYFLSSNPPFLGVYGTHQNLCLELFLSTVIYLVLFTTSMSHVRIGWAQILGSRKAIIMLK